ncbi:MAG: hypothetical protein NDJ94_03080 [Vicinamibacteria bacterium]|jgi:hypothetical protein|nr:hypothetical protein [Vicinamibacteria bacterium]
MLELLVGLVLGVGLLVLLPLLLLKLVFGVVAFAVWLPFKILGLAFGLVWNLFAAIAKLAFSIFGVLALAVLAVFALVMIPLLPFLFVGALVWAAVKLVGGAGTAPAAA